ESKGFQGAEFRNDRGLRGVQNRAALVSLIILRVGNTVARRFPNRTVIDPATVSERGGIAKRGSGDCVRVGGWLADRVEVIRRKLFPIVVGVNQRSLTDLAQVVGVDRLAGGIPDFPDSRDKNRGKNANDCDNS